MAIKEYEEAIKIIQSKCKTDSEKEINRLFLELQFGFIDCNVKLLRNKQEVGEIDGLFILEDQYLIILGVDEQKKQDSDKLVAFFTKWNNQENLKEIIKNYKIKETIKTRVVYVSREVPRPAPSTVKESTKHELGKEDNKVIYKEDIDHYQEAFSVIGPWAKNELLDQLGLQFKRTLEEKDAIRISMGGKKAYLFAATAEELLKTSYIYRKGENSLGGYQRVLKTNRVKHIKKAIEDKKILAFPNSIILNSKVELLEKTYATASGEYCKIKFPTSYLSFKVVDGQHRLMGFTKLTETERKNHYLPVVVFEDLPKEQELGTFITINTEQKNIDPNLLLILKADLEWQEDHKFYIEKQATLMAIKLNDNKNFFLRGKLFLGYNFPKKGKITLTTFSSAIKKNNLVAGKDYLLGDDINKATHEIKIILESVKNNLKDYCEVEMSSQSDIRGFFLSNNGLRVIFRLVQFFLRNKAKGNIPEKTSYEDFFKDVASSISRSDVENLMKDFGEGGFINATNKIISKLKQKYKAKYSKFKSDLKKI